MNNKIKYGSDIVSGISKIASKIGIPLKNWHLPGHKYTGPFTELDKRLDANEKPLPGFEPYNQIDAIALNHDLCYKHADEKKTDSLTRKVCDKQMLNELDNTKTKGIREKIDYAIVKPIIWLKHKLGLGLEEAKELHKPIRKKFKRRRVLVYNVDDIWSADLTNSFQSLSRENKGYKYMLNVIDLLSKYAYSIPLKSKSSESILEAFNQLFKFTKRHPKKLWTDQGSEFINSKFKDFLKDHNIELYHIYNEGKACVIERFNRTLGEMIQKHLTAKKTNKYIDILQELLDEYNNKYHSSIKMTPYEASKPKNRERVIKNLYSNIESSNQHPKFKIGDRVRIYKYKPLFEKGYKPNWTTEIFVISKINETNPITYSIQDLNGEDILGSFYEEELQITKF